MAEVKWIKIYIDMFDKRKIKKLRRLPAGNELLLIWIMLLATAGKCNAGGMIYITDSVPFTEEDLADELGFDVNTIRLALKAFEELDMIAQTDDGFIEVIGWEEYQNVEGMEKLREQTRKRVAEHRQRKRLEACNVTVTLPVTECNATEEEGEKDKEKEFHSFTQSAEAKMELIGGSLGGGVVFLSQDQMDDLLDKLSLDEFEKYVAIVRDCEKNGKPYKKKTHYQAILEMAMKDRKVKA